MKKNWNLEEVYFLTGLEKHELYRSAHNDTVSYIYKISKLHFYSNGNSNLASVIA